MFPVFKVASKVHIQSGPFSFFFENKFGDSGLGMVTPTNQDHEDLPDGVRTRITLILSDPSKFDAHVKEFREIPDTLILFLSKLKSITVLIEPLVGDSSETIYSCGYDEQSSSVKLTKVLNGEFLSCCEKEHFALTRGSSPRRAKSGRSCSRLSS